MAAKMALPLVSEIPLPQNILLPRQVQSCANSCTLTPVGTRFQDSDKESDEADVGMLTPPWKVMWSPPKPWQAQGGDNSSTDGDDKSLVATQREFGDECCNCETGFANNVFPFAPGLVNTVKTQQLLTTSFKMPLTPSPIKSNMVQADPAPSIGSMGHPFTCEDACKYFRRKGGCKDRAKCAKCHLCRWSRDIIQKKPSVQDRTPLKIAIPEIGQDDGPPSVGSIGHPFSCNVACKYQSKKAGCKDGKLCARCHLCRWTHTCEKTNANGEGKIKTRFAPECESTTAGYTQKMHEANKLGFDRTPAFKLPSPRRVQIKSGDIEMEVPMYIQIDGTTSF